MKVRDVFDRAAAIGFIEKNYKGQVTRRASSRLAACELELAPVAEGDAVLASIGGTDYGIPQSELEAILFQPE